MVGILLSYWEGLFSGAMLVSGRIFLLIKCYVSVCQSEAWKEKCTLPVPEEFLGDAFFVKRAATVVALKHLLW